jgi:hypothetical protein
MKGKDLLIQLRANLPRIGASEKNLQFYNEITETLNNFEILDSFHQLKKNDKGSGLALEVMMFNNELLHDIVITKTEIDFISVKTNCVNMAFIETSFGETRNENEEISIIDNLKLTISYGGDMRTLGYNAEVKKFTEFIRIKNNLLKIITT